MAIERENIDLGTRQALEQLATPAKDGGFVKNLTKHVRGITAACLGLLGAGEIGCAHTPIIVPSASETSQRQACVVFVHRNDSLDQQAQEELFKNINEYLRGKYSNLHVINMGLIGRPEYAASDSYDAHREAGKLVDRYIQKHNVRLVANEQCDDIIGIEFLKYLFHTKCRNLCMFGVAGCQSDGECGVLDIKTRLYVVNSENNAVVTDVKHSYPPYHNVRADDYTFGDLDKTLMEDYTEDIDDLLDDKLLTIYNPDQLPALSVEKVELILRNEIKRLYAKFKNPKQFSNVDRQTLNQLAKDYFSKFPNSHYINEIQIILTDIAQEELYKSVDQLYAEYKNTGLTYSKLVQLVQLANDYLTKFPNAQYATSVHSILKIIAINAQCNVELEGDFQKQRAFQEIVTAYEQQIINFFKLAANFKRNYPQSHACCKSIDDLYNDLVKIANLQVHQLTSRIPIRDRSLYESGEYFEQSEIIITTPAQMINQVQSEWYGRMFGVGISADGSKLGYVWLEEVWQGQELTPPPSRSEMDTATAIWEGLKFLGAVAIQEAPGIYRAAHKTMTFICKNAPEACAPKTSVTTYGNGEIEVRTGMTGPFACTDDGIAIKLPYKQETKCTTFSGPSCVIPNLQPGEYEIYAHRSGGCKEQKVGPVKITVEPNEKIYIDFSQDLE